MDLILKETFTFYGDQVKKYEIADGLTLEKSANYIASLVNKGFIFQGARITSDSDKESMSFPGAMNIENYNDLVIMLKSTSLEQEPKLCVTVFGKLQGQEHNIVFDIDRNLVNEFVPIKKTQESDFVEETRAKRGRR